MKLQEVKLPRTLFFRLQIVGVLFAILMQILLGISGKQVTSLPILYNELRLVVIFYLVSLFVYSYSLYYHTGRSAELIDQRNRWLRDIVERSLEKSESRSQFIQKYLQTVTSTHDSEAMRRELGLSSTTVRASALPPDLALAEQEIIQAEDRSTVLIATSIFFPIVFAIAHLFRSVYFITLSLEALLLLALVESIILYYQHTVKIVGWKDSLAFLETIEEHIISGGMQSYTELTELLKHPHSSELGNQSRIQLLSPAKTAVATCVLVVSKLPKKFRKDVLSTFVQQTRELPMKEELLAVKFQALKSRVLLVTTTGVATAGLFAGVANFSVPAIDAGILGIQSTMFLPIVLFGLTLSISYIVASQWTSTLKAWVVIWVVEYWLLYLLINLFIF